MLDSHLKSFTEKVLFPAVELSSGRVEHASIKTDLDGIKALVQCLKKDIKKLLVILSKEVLETFEDMVLAVKLEMRAHFVTGCKNM